MCHVLEEPDLELLLGSEQAAVRAVGSMLGYYFDFYLGVFGRRCSAMHDPLAAAIALGNVKLLSAPYARVVVDTTQGPGRGQTICDLRGRYKGSPKPAGSRCRVVLDADSTAMAEIMRGALRAGAPAHTPLA